MKTEKFKPGDVVVRIAKDKGDRMKIGTVWEVVIVKNGWLWFKDGESGLARYFRKSTKLEQALR